MSCYHPICGVPDGVTSKGKIHYKLQGEFIRDNKLHPDWIPIPCGRCIGCRLDQSREWANRMLLELDHYHNKAIFLTLTYNNENAVACKFDDYGNPLAYTLVKSDFQAFMKRLRSRVEFENKEIRFYACGEYGSRTFRPHYHAIIFGICVTDIPGYFAKEMNEFRQMYYSSKWLEDVWTHGFVLFSEVSWQTCAYVARYVQKKAYNEGSVQEYLNQLPEFSLMSRNPGLGAFYFVDHPERLGETTFYISDSNGSKEISLPKYFLRKVDKDGNMIYTEYEDYKNRAKLLISDKEFLQLQKTDLGYLEKLEQDENRKLVSANNLQRYL